MFDFLPRIAWGILREGRRPRVLPNADLTFSFRVLPFLDTDGIRMLAAAKYVALGSVATWVHNYRNGFLHAGLRRGWFAVTKQQYVRFHRSVRLFARVDVVTRVACWDDYSTVRLLEFHSGGKLCATMYMQNVLLSRAGKISTWEAQEKMGMERLPSPPWPPEVQGWRA